MQPNIEQLRERLQSDMNDLSHDIIKTYNEVTWHG
jgi:hypothetical protein